MKKNKGITTMSHSSFSIFFQVLLRYVLETPYVHDLFCFVLVLACQQGEIIIEVDLSDLHAWYGFLEVLDELDLQTLSIGQVLDNSCLDDWLWQEWLDEIMRKYSSFARDVLVVDVVLLVAFLL